MNQRVPPRWFVSVCASAILAIAATTGHTQPFNYAESLQKLSLIHI